MSKLKAATWLLMKKILLLQLAKMKEIYSDDDTTIDFAKLIKKVNAEIEREFKENKKK